MSLSYTWKLKSFKKQDNPSIQLNDIIVQTHWEITGTDKDGNSGVFNGATPFEPEISDPENFTEYSDLTEGQVLSWIQETVNNNPGYKAHIDSQIQKQINEKVIPTVEVSGNTFPWVTNDPS